MVPRKKRRMRDIFTTGRASRRKKEVSLPFCKASLGESEPRFQRQLGLTD